MTNDSQKKQTQNTDRDGIADSPQKKSQGNAAQSQAVQEAKRVVKQSKPKQ